eukprot:GDKJ01028338.1.p1 GENE.GDKJ01028338.1~~GDKJ01028338.1.p1  ORF type:complete len:486 (-),score=82.28 GDKJ01028338.1:772-2229(-)
MSKIDQTVAPKLGAEHKYDASQGVVYEEFKKSKYATEKELSQLPLFEQINWLSTNIIFLPLVFALLLTPFIELKFPTLVFAMFWYFCCGCGITMGYHRLWSHCAYKARLPVEIVLACFGAAAFQGSARWWSRNHRVHHRYVDSEKDPYAVHRGFWFAHLGWMVFKQDSRRFGRVDISDLNANAVLQFQHKYYLPIALITSVFLPCFIGVYFLNDFWGTLTYACFWRIALLHQATFCINSVAHYWGTQPFSAGHSAKDSVLCALLTNGEGYHNFHHEYPHDYRNALQWYQFDPTKWTIRMLSSFGLTYDLNRVSDNEIRKARAQAMAVGVEWGIQNVEELPEKWTSEKLLSEARERGRMVFAIGNRVIELSHDFIENHPGGASILKFWVGRDCTSAFNGTVYNHSKGARNLLAHYTIAHFVDGKPETFRCDGRDPVAINFCYGRVIPDAELSLKKKCCDESTSTATPSVSEGESSSSSCHRRKMSK